MAMGKSDMGLNLFWRVYITKSRSEYVSSTKLMCLILIQSCDQY